MVGFDGEETESYDDEEEEEEGEERKVDLGVRGVAEEVEEVGGLQNAGGDLLRSESLERGAALRVGRHSCHPRLERASYFYKCFLLPPRRISQGRPPSGASFSFLFFSCSVSILSLSLSPTLALVPFLHPFRCYTVAA